MDNRRGDKERERGKREETNSHRRWQLSQWNVTEDKNRSLQQSSRRALRQTVKKRGDLSSDLHLLLVDRMLVDVADGVQLVVERHTTRHNISN